MLLKDIPNMVDKMATVKAHIFVGKKFHQVPFVSGFKRDNEGVLWVSFFPPCFNNKTVMLDVDDVVESVCSLKSGVVGRLEDGVFVDLEKEICG
jgi:hypothetical protein